MLISQTRNKRSKELSEVQWRGRSLPVKPEKVRSCLAADQELKESFERSMDNQAKIAVIENLLMDCKDAISLVKEELKNDPVSE
jgi:signal recognition particle subunit SRP68